MTNSRAILIGFSLIAGAILAVGYAQRGVAQSASMDYQITSTDAGAAWAINSTGRVLYCANALVDRSPGCVNAKMAP